MERKLFKRANVRDGSIDVEYETEALFKNQQVRISNFDSEDEKGQTSPIDTGEILIKVRSRFCSALTDEIVKDMFDTDFSEEVIKNSGPVSEFSLKDTKPEKNQNGTMSSH